jgi:large subunit ribosomal protein L17
MPSIRKLGKATDARMAMLRQQVTDLLDLGRMETTVTRAKEIAPLAEKMITLGKQKDMAAYRQALSFITREDVAKRYSKYLLEIRRAYRRIHPYHRIGPRRGDPRKWPSSNSYNRINPKIGSARTGVGADPIQDGSRCRPKQDQQEPVITLAETRRR